MGIFIENNCFSHCTHLQEIMLPKNIQGINDEAFSCIGPSSLQKINIPKTLTFLGLSIFRGCHQLTKLEIEDPNKLYYQFLENKNPTHLDYHRSILHIALESDNFSMAKALIHKYPSLLVLTDSNNRNALEYYLNEFILFRKTIFFDDKKILQTINFIHFFKREILKHYSQRSWIILEQKISAILNIQADNILKSCIFGERSRKIIARSFENFRLVRMISKDKKLPRTIIFKILSFSCNGEQTKALIENFSEHDNKKHI